jgi:LPXTG-motif cell wall-anchored protein
VKSQFDSKKYSMNLDDCKETPKPVMIDVCRLSDKKIVSIDEKDFTTSKYSKTLDDCKEVPQPPKELPHTGVVDGIASVVGLGSLVAAGGYYLASRRALR